MKICLVKTSSMGDVIHTLPALTDAQNAIPNLEVDWVIEPDFAEIPKWHSAVNQVIPFALRQWRKRLFSRNTLQQWQAYKKQIQAKKYDAVIDAQGLLKSALFITYLAHGKKFGYDKNSAREGLSACFYDHTFNIPYQQHAVERIRQLFANTLGYVLPKTIGDYNIAKHFSPMTACNPYIVVIHSTSREDKHWQESYWINLFQQLAELNLEIHLPWGTEHERARSERFSIQCSNVKVLPKLTLSEIANEIAGSIAVVSVDTGLSHLTAALDKANVILYGKTDPKLIGAYGRNQFYVQRQGMDNILPEHIFQAVKKAI